MSRDASALVGGALTQADWAALDGVVRGAHAAAAGNGATRALVTVFGGVWMTLAASVSGGHH